MDRKTADPISPRNFRAVYCKKFECSTEDFALDCLRRCVPVKGRWLLRLPGVGRRLFRADLTFLSEAGLAQTLESLRAEFSRYRYHQPPQGWLRGGLQLRMSGRLLMRLAARLLSN